MISFVEPCVHRPPCPGCPRFGAPGLAPQTARRLAEFCRRHGLRLPRVIEGPASGYRHRARLAVRGSALRPSIGIFREGTHRAVDIPSCAVHHPLVNEVAAELKRALGATGAPPYSEERRGGLVRYVQIVVERATATAQVVAVLFSESAADGRSLAVELSRRLDAKLGSLWLNLNPSERNAIVGADFVHVAGPPAVRETLGGADVFFPPGAFGQSNLPLFDVIVRDIAARVPGGARVVECYAGVGAIGLGLVERSGDYAFNETATASLDGLSLGIAALSEASRGKARVLPGPAADFSDEIGAAEVVIVDPPRRGLEPGVSSALARGRVERVLYLSCGLESLIRDAEALTAPGRLRAAEVQAYALFPYTDHVETLVAFERV